MGLLRRMQQKFNFHCVERKDDFPVVDEMENSVVDAVEASGVEEGGDIAVDGLDVAADAAGARTSRVRIFTAPPRYVLS